MSKIRTQFLLLAVIVIYSFSIPQANAETEKGVKPTFTPEEQAFIKEHPVIIVGGETDWPPYDFVENGEYTGAAKDYLLTLEKYTGFTFEVRTGFTWDELLKGLKNKKFDMLPIIFWHDQRTKYMHYTDPYFVIRHYIFIHKDSEGIESLKDLYGKTIAIPKGFVQIAILKEHHPEINILEVDGALNAMDAVVTKKADALIESTALVSYLSEQNNIKGLKPAFASDLAVNNMHMASRYDWPLLRDILQKGLNAMTHDEYAEIAEKWLGYEAGDADTSYREQKIVLTDEERRYLQEKKMIKMCIDPDWMPIEGIKDGEYVGMGADYLALFQKKLPIPIEVVPTQSRANSLSFAISRKCDMFIFNTSKQIRQGFMDVSSSYLKLPIAIATKPDVLFISNLSDLSNKPIGIVKGYALEDAINKDEAIINFVSVSSRNEGLQKVIDGELFGFMDVVSSLDYVIISEHYDELKIGGKFGVDWELGASTRNDEPLLAQIIEKIVLQISQQTKQKIYHNWVTTKYTQGFDYDLFWKIIAVFLIVIAIIFFRNRQLIIHREEIHQKNLQLEDINARLEEQKNEVQHLADHDFLTNLPNRKSFLSKLDHAISIASRQKYNLAVLFLDLDRFKNINDSLGHHIGDDILQAVSDRLKDELRESDTIARIGGDEFLILLEAINDVAYPRIVADKILTRIRQPIELSEHTLSLSVSIGIALYPDDGATSDILIKNADSAMYHAKEKGKDHFQYYTEQLSEKIDRRLTIEQSLKDAVQNQQLSLCFQPQIDLRHECIIGAEALVRWQHPKLGNISPVEFIPIAEDSGVIIDIGEWVFRNACQEYVKWRKAGHELDCLSINVSSVQFNQDNLSGLFSDIINQLDVAAHHIEIEITERYIMEHTNNKLHVLNSLRDLGFRISVDDFGTGYSSMAYLKTLPLDIIKIDKSFISDIPQDNNDVQITKAILALSNSLGYMVIAEGIETEEQLKILQEMSCNTGQGYYFSKPVPSDEFLKLLDKNEVKQNIHKL